MLNATESCKSRVKRASETLDPHSGILHSIQQQFNFSMLQKGFSQCQSKLDGVILFKVAEIRTTFKFIPIISG